ncbi:UNVERIFIED_ORG: phosphonopyruvate decarboxylase [Agrobacterium larrymoorei]|uniref:Phosphonopyruvate decarboxylase n=1 Tax=Agrobacterium cavarae TaxID=2528239 RepID=A0ABY1YD46_9HYPH|nr:phosphonopyruvate decarboxylase [Agrobacterium cavarae]MDP9573971.1 phosphonopyruvate decarboxylase [Agrobacterium larrymoorei]TBN18448.1 phosphonopyruvate decarboxylase [Agrobacterium cavarae]
MISSETFLSAAKARRHDFYVGVPCSSLAPLINGALTRPDATYVGASSEGEAVAIASGAWLANRPGTILCQNSGLGNAVNPLTSLNIPFRIPVLVVTSWRGQPGIPDEPQHAMMGTITQQLLSLMQIPHGAFPETAQSIHIALDEACAHMSSTDLPFALVAADGALERCEAPRMPAVHRSEGVRVGWQPTGERPSRMAVLERFLSLVDQTTAVIATTGKCGRELFTLADRPQHLYMVGALGCASSVGLGVALNSTTRVAVLDGDGSVLMKMGALATIGATRPSNLLHIILDNGVHDSTGGQATSPVDFATVATACGYAFVADCADIHGFEEAFLAASRIDGPACIHMRIASGSISKLGRPALPPEVVARRFKAFLADHHEI